MQIDQRHGPCSAPRRPDQHALGGKGRVERRQRPLDRGLPARLKHAVNLARPVDIDLPGLGQKLDLDTGQRQIVGQGRVEDTIDEDDSQPVDAVKDRRFICGRKGGRARSVRRNQIGRVGIAPVFIAPGGQSHRPQARQRLGPCRTRPAAACQIKPRDPCGKRIKLCLGYRHHSASARMSA